MTELVCAAAALLALLIDRLFGEPPVRLHPVVWMGHYLGWSGQRVQQVALPTALGAWSQPAGSAVAAALQPVADYKAFWLAALYWTVGAAMFVIAAWWLEVAVWQLAQALADLTAVNAGKGWSAAVGAVLAAVLLALLLKPMLAWAMLQSEVLAVEAALADSLPAGRARLSWLVSRDTSVLSEAQVRESAIESLAENLSDSVVAPIFWFVLLGLPGAVLYRFANTADAMWGYKGVYKGQNWEWAGKWAARFDDVLNWLPARLTGCLLWLWVSLSRRTHWQCSPHGTGLGDGLLRFSLRQLRCEAAKTPSPNSGWPMAAMALALNIHLRKPGVYVLNPLGRAPLTGHTSRAIFYASKVLLALMITVLIAMLLKSLTVS